MKYIDYATARPGSWHRQGFDGDYSNEGPFLANKKAEEVIAFYKRFGYDAETLIEHSPTAENPGKTFLYFSIKNAPGEPGI